MGAAEEALLQRLSAAFCGQTTDGKSIGDVERARNVLLLVGTHREPGVEGPCQLNVRKWT